MTDHAIRTLLLAAGRSGRFGADKLVTPLPDGKPMVLATAEALRAGGADLLAVVGAAREPARAGAAALLRQAGIDVLDCPESAHGLGHSIACGVRASADAGGWLVALGDMPFVQPATVRRLLQALASGAALVAPVHRGRRGHPVGFGARWRSELTDLRGDTGARALLEAQQASLLRIEVDDAGTRRDIDTPADLCRPGA